MSEGRIGVLISGRGSNMVAIVEACREARIGATVVLVASNEPGAQGLERARGYGIEAAVVDHRASAGREEHDRRLAALFDARACDLICLAGYMRRVTPWFVAHYPMRVMNIHPALLPAFPGLGAQAAAIAHGVKVAGLTVHFVDEQIDHGPIILQIAVPVREGDTVESLSARVLAEEHRAYPEGVRLFFEGRLAVEGRKVRVGPPRG
jgi:phosphoribosylglycinamide formyltransferase-1